MGSPSTCKLYSSYFYVNFFGETISNDYKPLINTGGKSQHRSVDFLDDRRPLPSCCGKYHICNFGNRTGALEMWVLVFLFSFFKRERCSRIILPVEKKNQFLLSDSKSNGWAVTIEAVERELGTIGV